jgi:RNA polymerase sigma-70 factor, ECF subfamily
MSALATLERVEPDTIGDGVAVPAGLDGESREWLESLRGGGHEREQAVARLHDLLLRAARFEVRRRSISHIHLRGGDLDDLAVQAADDALVAVLAKLDGYRGDSRFTTWVYKFGLLEAAVKVRKRAWQGRELPIADDTWALMASQLSSPSADTERSELLEAITAGIDEALSDRQREVLVALALNGVPIDVLAERNDTTRGALYKMLHDARHKLRRHLIQKGFNEFEEDDR